MQLNPYVQQVEQTPVSKATRYSATSQMPAPYQAGPGPLERAIPGMVEAGTRLTSYFIKKDRERSSNEATERALEAQKEVTDFLAEKVRTGETENIDEELRALQEDLIVRNTEDLNAYGSQIFRTELKHHMNAVYRDTVLKQAEQEEKRNAANFAASMNESIQNNDKVGAYETLMRQVGMGNADFVNLGIRDEAVEGAIKRLLVQAEESGDYTDAAIAYIKAAEFEGEELIDPATSYYAQIQSQLRFSQAKQDLLETDPDEAWETIVSNPQLMDSYGLSEEQEKYIVEEVEKRVKDKQEFDNRQRKQHQQGLFDKAVDEFADYSLTQHGLTEYLDNGMTKEDYSFFKNLLEWRLKLSEDLEEDEQEELYDDLETQARRSNVEYTRKLATVKPEDAGKLIKQISEEASLFYDHGPSHNAFDANGLISKYKTKLDDELSRDFLNKARRDALSGALGLTPSDWADFEDRVAEYNMYNVYDPKTWDFRENAPSSEERTTSYQNILNNFLAEKFGTSYLDQMEEQGIVARNYVPDEFTLPKIRELIGKINKKGKIRAKGFLGFETTRDEEKVVQFINNGGFFGITGLYSSDLEKYAQVGKNEIEDLVGKEGARVKYYENSIPVYVFGEGRSAKAYVLDTQYTPNNNLELVAKPFTQFASEKAIVRADPVSQLQDKIATTYANRNEYEHGWTGQVLHVRMDIDSSGREKISGGQILLKGEPQDLLELWNKGKIKKWGNISKQTGYVPGMPREAGKVRVFMDGKQIEDPSATLDSNAWVLDLENGYHILQFPNK